jgi:hypothetical protein
MILKFFLRNKKWSIPVGLISGFVSFAALFVSCEKDDICVDGDTPQLIVTFYKTADPTQLAAVTKLRISGIGMGTPVDTFSDRSNRDSIALPLRADAESTGFVFYLNSASNDEGLELGNPDTIYFNYSTQSVFVSRACGFVPNFEDFSASLIEDNNLWINSIEVKQTRISNTNSSHVSIYY